MAQLFGFEIRRKSDQEDQPQSFAPEITDDGALVVAAGGVYGTVVDLDGGARSEAELVTKYRLAAMQPEVETAIDTIIQESIVYEENTPIVTINLEELKVSRNIQKMIEEEFNTVLDLLDFNNQSHDLFKRWYVDGRMYYHAIVDENDIRAGIKELRYVDPRKIRKIKEVKKARVKDNREVTVTEIANEYYVYNEKGWNSPSATTGVNTNSNSGVRIAKDSIVHATSGIMDEKSSMVLSYLHKALKPINQLRALEDATVIYRLSRAPERRIFYIDVGNLPKIKAEQYLQDMMTRHKNKIVYDSASGEVRDDRKFMSMMEDYWMPRREGGKGTEITTLPGGQNLGEMDDVLYFQKKLYSSLNVPESRLNSEAAFNIGRASEVTREEIRFSKFVDRLRARFAQVFIKTLEKQLILKGIVTSDDWALMGPKLKFNFARDNYFSELKEMEILKERMSTLQTMDQYVGKYYSNEWVRKNILRQTEEQIEELNDEIIQERASDIYNAPVQMGPDGQPIPGPAPAGNLPPGGINNA